MNRAGEIKEVILGDLIRLDDIVAVARWGAKVKFGEEYKKRVNDCRALVSRFVAEKRRMYGITTGLGENVKRAIPEDDTIRCQENTLLTHCVSVGEPLDEEAVRAIMFMLLANMGTGYSGPRLELLERIAEMLNKRVTPWTPRHGSVGYLALEAHIGLVLLGKGKAWHDGILLDGGEALKRAGIEPIILSYKEGLCLTNGVTSVTALGALAAYDARNLVETADVVASCSLEVLRANLSAFSEKAMSVKKQPEQSVTASHVREILKDSDYLKKFGGRNLQDALSMRCVPQAHGASRRTIADGAEVIKNELNSCTDNPIVHPSGEVISACNADSGYVGIESDSICIAVAYLAKISERRTDRLVNEHVSGLPPFLVSNPGTNNGYMIVQYASAGLLGEIRLLAHPASVDSVPTCALQEDYVGMGYNSVLKARKAVELAEYVLGNELLCAAQAADLCRNDGARMSTVTSEVASAVRERAPFMKDDHYISPDLEWAREIVHSGRARGIAEKSIGSMIEP
ncbi:histidine ammonia-lyase [Synergistales bacterium]|nr:histidine ammonia-lyase [Synergistales bacterium]